uniref:Uncharacterized protein n=1 Tax=Callithrix jacchus TaxID=9483 RepID=A0A8I3WMJ6_CALJA
MVGSVLLVSVTQKQDAINGCSGGRNGKCSTLPGSYSAPRVSLCGPAKSAVVSSGLTATSCLPDSSSSHATAFQVAWTTGAHHHTWLIFVVLVETGFCHAGQAGLELLTSSDPPASASQGAVITGVSHCIHPLKSFLNIECSCLKKKSITCVCFGLALILTILSAYTN